MIKNDFIRFIEWWDFNSQCQMNTLLKVIPRQNIVLKSKISTQRDFIRTNGDLNRDFEAKYFVNFVEYWKQSGLQNPLIQKHLTTCFQFKLSIICCMLLLCLGNFETTSLLYICSMHVLLVVFQQSLHQTLYKYMRLIIKFPKFWNMTPPWFPLLLFVLCWQ